ncbi:hypothetical protein B0A54_17651 [Friedmanniomyces endolithicus]|uniref:Fungal N-terminal domain-containing protein n=1 Tax=Friedmanniomyces endolithicus TaxID=329885 RepID=A0A4U0TW21_9PEZI|nr:hypothetical protein B0A54_17651 [Friedmanniomyces endolithicus]
MAFQPLSVGDILMLSQTAWKIGRAFTKGKTSAPSEFAEVEHEANGLSEALKLVAETLHTDGGILSQADGDTKNAVNTILESARRPLSDLESFVDRYQVIRKERTNGGGFVVERSWSEVVLANYRTFKWTTEGGDITELRNMLGTPTNTINLVMQALQSRSLARLEKTVMPMAENIVDIHELVHGDLGSKIDDLHPDNHDSCEQHTLSPSSRPRESNVARRESTTLPKLFNAIYEADAEVDGSEDTPDTDMLPNASSSALSSTTGLSRAFSGESSLPSPAIPPDEGVGLHSAATPASFLGSPSRQRNNAHDGPRPQTAKTVRPSKRDSADFVGAPKGRIGDPSFEKLLFRNAAIICEVRAKSVEYAQTLPDEPDPRYNTEMREACKGSRICVIRKREHREHGGTKIETSIWAIADDGDVRLQQKLSEINETVSLQPSEGFGSEIALRFHAEKWDEVLLEKKTSWINYVFVSENDAIAFQSAVFGRKLLGSFGTNKTTILHEGFKGAFAFEEPFANIELLRLWEDDGISTPGAADGVLALMHVSSNFGEGWARWWINSSKQQVRVKEDGAKWARVKSIDVTVIKPGSGAAVADKIRSPSMAGEGLQRVETSMEARPTGGKRIPVKSVTGIKVDFKAEGERAKFVSQCKRVQEKMIPLPDV